MPFYNEFTKTFEFNNGTVDIICTSMSELIKQANTLAGVNILQYLN